MGMFENNPRGEQLFIVQVAFLGFSWVLGLLRAWVKIAILKKVTIEDYVMLVALLVFTAYSTVAIIGIADGLQRSTSSLTIEDAALALRGWWLCEVLYPPLVILTRASLALLLLRIAVVKVHRRIIYANVAIVGTLATAQFFLILFQCTPVSFFWNQVLQSGRGGRCIDPDIVPNATIALSIVSAISDWVVGLLPIAILWNVRIRTKTRIGLWVLLGMGLLAGAAMVVRIPYLKTLQINGSLLRQTFNFAMWSIIEPSLGILAGCAATLKPLFTKQSGLVQSPPASGGGTRSAPCGGNRQNPESIGVEDSVPHTRGRAHRANLTGSDAELVPHAARPAKQGDSRDSGLGRYGMDRSTETTLGTVSTEDEEQQRGRRRQAASPETASGFETWLKFDRSQVQN